MKEMLMHLCRNWGKKKCHPKVKKMKRLGKKEDFELNLLEDELNKLDEICYECEFFKD